MRNEKSLFPRFAPRERKRMIRFLEAQAQKGWLFCGFGGLGWKFCRTEARKLRFAVTYFTAQTGDDLDRQLKKEVFLEYCAHAGWQFAGESGCMQIFYTEKEDAVPIETDPRLEVESVYLAQGAGFESGFLVIFCIFLFSTISLWLTNESSIILLFTDQACTWSLLGTLVMSIMYGLSALELKLWYKKAKSYAEAWGEFLDESSVMVVLKWIGYIGLFLLFAALIFSADLKVFLWKMAAWGLMIGVMNLVWSWIESKNYDKRKRHNRLFFAYCLIFFFMASIEKLTSDKLNVGFDLNVPEGSAWVQHMEVPPLTDDETDDYTITLRETGFLARYSVEGEGTDFPYTVLDVKVDCLYDTCLNEMLPNQYFSAEPAPWRAISAYQYGASEYMCNPAWLLCYEDRIVEIRLEEEPTAEQMALIGETLGGN